MDTEKTPKQEPDVTISYSLAKRLLAELDGGRSGQDEERELKAAVEQAEGDDNGQE